MNNRGLIFILIFISTTLISKGAQVKIDGLTYDLNNEDMTAIVAGHEDLTANVVIPSIIAVDGQEFTVTEIGEKCFHNCFKLTSIEFPNTLVRIGDFAFEGCNILEEIDIPDSVEEVGESCFHNCFKLKKATIGEGVRKIGKDCFSGCDELETFVYNAEECIFEVTSMSDVHGPGFSDNPAKPVLPSVSNLKIGNKVRRIPDFFFYSNNELKELNLPSSVISIGKRAFYECREIKKANIPSSVVEISESAFSWSNLQNLIIEDGTEPLKLGENAFRAITCENLYLGRNIEDYVHPFRGDSYLKELTIDGGVTKIDFSEFSDCMALKNVRIGDSVVEIGSDAFNNCKNLNSVSIGNSVREIGFDAFEKCVNLKKVNINRLEDWLKINFRGTESNPLYQASHLYLNDTEIINLVIPESVSMIPYSAFNGARYIKTLSLNSKEQMYIGGCAFEECYNLTDIYANTPYIPETPSLYTIFPINVFSVAVLHVPAKDVEAYKSDSFWRSFKNIVPIETDGVEGIVDDEATSYTVYTTDGRLVLKDGRKEDLDGLKKGLYVINGRKVIR